jgi:hypothetical protein
MLKKLNQYGTRESMGQSEYYTGMKKAIEDEEYEKWMFMLGKYYRGRRDYAAKLVDFVLSQENLTLYMKDTFAITVYTGLTHVAENVCL